MKLNVGKELAALRRMSVDDLRRSYAEVFGETTNGRHKEWLIKRIIYRLQALAEGDLSERARRRAAELANDADLRRRPPNRRRQSLKRRPEPRPPSCRPAATRGFRFPAARSPASTKARRLRSRCCPPASNTKARSTSRSAPWPRRSPARTQRLPLLPPRKKGGDR